MKIAMIDRVGPYRTGNLNKAVDEIVAVLGPANCDDDPDKVKYSWGFEVDGKYAAIWDYKGSHTYDSFSTYDPDGVVDLIFNKETV